MVEGKEVNERHGERGKAKRRVLVGTVGVEQCRTRHADLRVRREKGGECSQSAGEELGVRVEQTEKVAGRGLQALIGRHCKAPVLRIRNHLHMGELLTHHRRAVVGGRIVHHDHLIRRAWFGGYGRQATRQEVPGVVRDR